MALLMENREIMDLKDKFLQTEQRNNSLCWGSWNERELICRRERIGIFNIHSSEISIQQLWGGRVSFGIRSFIFYIFLCCSSLFQSSLWQKQSVINVIMINYSTQPRFTHLPNCNFPSLYFKCPSKQNFSSPLPLCSKNFIFETNSSKTALC